MRISFGEVNGNDWERYCQQLLKLKYGDTEGYQEVPDRYGGDLGIEGFTQTGRAFQCYCAEGEPPPKELYESQRDKVTRDISKLLKNETELKRILGDIAIKEWHFLTPRYDSKELIAHCVRKAEEVKLSGKSHIAPDFTILIRTDDDFIPERETYLSAGISRISFDIPQIPEEEVIEWKESHNEYFETLESKLTKIINDIDKRSSQAANMVRNYLLGQNILEDIRRGFPGHYEKIARLKNATERNVEIMSGLDQNNPGELLKNTLSDYQETLYSELNRSLDRSIIMGLGQEAISDWLIRCPLDF